MTARTPGRCPRCGSIDTTATGSYVEPRWRDRVRAYATWTIQRCDDCLIIWLEVPAT